MTGLIVVAAVAVLAWFWPRGWRALVVRGRSGPGRLGLGGRGPLGPLLGYAERADDLLVTSGVLNRQLVVVPYGRMQFVDVTAGPLDRRFGLATVQLHTASPATDAQIPGSSPPKPPGCVTGWPRWVRPAPRVSTARPVA